MSGAASITVRVPLAIRRRPGRKTVVVPEGAAAAAPTRTRADPALVKALARAFRGCVAKIAAGCEWPQQTKGQAAIWNSWATKAAWACMSRPPILRTCRFLAIAIAS